MKGERENLPGSPCFEGNASQVISRSLDTTSWRCGRVMIIAVRLTRDLAVRVSPRHFTLSVPLSFHVYQWVLAD